jgi:UDP-glucose:(heptosyl)LPS alpha-1,3-glucosyltransferase
MRIALLRQRYNPYGGAERFIERAIAALGADVALTVYAREWSGSGAADVVRCDPFYMGRLWRDWSYARAACRAAARDAPDLVQSHERIDCCDVYRAGDGVHARWLENRGAALGPLGRLALALHPYHHYVLAAERRLFASRRLRAVICNSRMVRDDIRRRFRVADEKLHVIYNGVDLDAFHPRLRAAHRRAMRERLGVAEDALLHLFVGSGYERKGVFPLLAAFAAARDRGAHLAVVGRDKAESRARALARSLGIEERVRFAGAQDDVAPWYGAADSFVLPTLYDPFPNAALEAMACGLPVVTTTQCGAAELIDEGVEGFVIDAGARAPLSGALDRLDAALARRMGENARRRAEAYGLEPMRRRMIELYRLLLGAKAPGARA